MPSSVLPVFAAVATIAVMVQLVRRRRLKEKYAVLWLVVAAGVGIVAALPEVLSSAATLLGVRTPSNLLFFVSSLVLLVISVQLSAEVSQLEEERRSLAEEMAILRLLVEQRDASPQASSRVLRPGPPVPATDRRLSTSAHERRTSQSQAHLRATPPDLGRTL